MVEEGKTKQYYLTYAKLCDSAELYDEMAESMIARSKINEEFEDEERNLFSIAFKNVIGKLRASYRVIANVEPKNVDDPLKTEINQTILDKIVEKVNKICRQVDETVDKYLYPNAITLENKVFFHKLQGDYFRYRCEVAQPANKEEFAKSAKKVNIIFIAL